tara:strand:- start:232 stop:540 length:309 start_codon:yes stop_codon:yes gene_type:complete
MYTDNLKGFRKRCMIKKLDILMKQIEDVIEYAHNEAIVESDYNSLKDSIDHTQYLKERIEELEEQYSIIWRIKLQLEKGIRTSKSDLRYVNDTHREIALGEY